ncbi:MAG: hypothetical protein OXI23_05445 [Gemmatimonadota bacterium]|nr:hypothetical protein [Gemmatimonadota bacterium]
MTVDITGLTTLSSPNRINIAQLIFTPDNWNQEQSVNVAASMEMPNNNLDEQIRLIHTCTSDDDRFDGHSREITIGILDNTGFTSFDFDPNAPSITLTGSVAGLSAGNFKILILAASEAPTSDLDVTVNVSGNQRIIRGDESKTVRIYAGLRFGLFAIRTNFSELTFTTFDMVVSVVAGNGYILGDNRQLTIPVSHQNVPLTLVASPTSRLEGGSFSLTLNRPDNLIRSLSANTPGAISVPLSYNPVLGETNSLLAATTATSIGIAAGASDNSISITTRVDPDNSDDTQTITSGAATADDNTAVLYTAPANVVVTVTEPVKTGIARLYVNRTGGQSASVREGNSHEIRITLSAAQTEATTIGISIASTRGIPSNPDYDDYFIFPETLTIPAGDLFVTGTVSTVFREDNFSSRSVTFQLSNLPSNIGSDVNANSVTYTLINRSILLSLSADAASVEERESFELTVTRAVVGTEQVIPITVTETIPPGETLAWVDDELDSITIPSGETSASATISIGQLTGTQSASLSFALGTPPTGYRNPIPNTPASVIITQYTPPTDPLSVSITVSDSAPLTGDSVVLTAVPAGGPAGDTTYEWAGTDLDTQDPPTTQSLTVSYNTAGARSYEVIASRGSETARASVTVTWNEPDATVSLSFSSSSVREGESTTLAVGLDQDPGYDVTIPLTFVGFTDANHTVNFVTGGTRSFTIDLTATFVLGGVNRTGTATIGTLADTIEGEGDLDTITIQNVIPQLSISASPTSVEENTENGVTVTVTRSTVADGAAITVPVTTTVPDELTVPDNGITSITIPSGETSASATISIGQLTGTQSASLSFALGTPPTGYRNPIPNTPASVIITQYTPPTDPLSVSITVSDSAPLTGDSVVLTAVPAGGPAGDTTYEWAGTDLDTQDPPTTQSIDVESSSIATGRYTVTIQRAGLTATASISVMWIEHDHTVGLSFNSGTNISAANVNEGSSLIFYTRLNDDLSIDNGNNLTVPISVSYGGSASASDVASIPSGITILDGQRVASGTLRTAFVIGTHTNKTVIVSIGTLPQNIKLGSPSSITATIVNRVPLLQIYSPTSVVENNNITLTVRRTVTTSGAITVPISVTQPAGQDVTITSITSIAIADGSASGTATIGIGSLAGTAAGSVTFAINDGATNFPTGYSKSTSFGSDTTTINQYVPPITRTVTIVIDPTSDRGRTGAVDVTVTISASDDSDTVIPLSYSYGGDANGDLVSPPNSITIPARQTSASVTINRNNLSPSQLDLGSINFGFGTLPAGIGPGTPATATLSINYTGTATPTVSVSISPDDPAPAINQLVVLTATVGGTATGIITYAWEFRSTGNWRSFGSNSATANTRWTSRATVQYRCTVTREGVSRTSGILSIPWGI